MNQNSLLIAAIVFTHWLDMLFTVLYIKKIEKKTTTAYAAELNYHRWFMQKFGVVKGALISTPISSIFLGVATYVVIQYYQGYSAAVFLFGLISGVAYVNYISWANYEQTMAELKRGKKSAKSRYSAKK